MSLGANIHRYRKKLNLTQEQLAESLQVSVGKLLEADMRVGQWELRDEMFSTDNLYRQVLDYITDHGLSQSMQALPQMMKLHEGQYRRGEGEVLQALRILYLPPDAKERKAAYYDGLRGSHLAALVRCIDWCNKMSTAAVGLPREKLYDYIEDTEEYILPLLEYVQQNSLQYYRAVFLLKYQILSVTESLKRIL